MIRSHSLRKNPYDLRYISFKRCFHFFYFVTDYYLFFRSFEGINIAQWPIRGLYLPDTIDYVSWNNEGYLLTANEGDAQEYDIPGSFWTEEIRGFHIDRKSYICLSVCLSFSTSLLLWIEWLKNTIYLAAF